MGRKKNESSGKEDWEDMQQYREYGLPPVDIKVMVLQLGDSARRLKECGDYEGAADAAATAILYSADAAVDSRFRRAMQKLQEEVGAGGRGGRPKFNNPKGPSLKSKLLR